MYTNNLSLNHHDGSIILDLLIAIDELLIVDEMFENIQDHLINVKSEWLENNFSLILHTVFNQNISRLRDILKDLIPLIRFSEFSIGEFYDKVWPYKDILPSYLRLEISKFQNNLEYLPKSILPPRNSIITIDTIYDDPSFGPCFGKTDLDMRKQFNEDLNCSAKKRCYKHTITTTTQFAVEDYEVFQVKSHA
ncbi:2562_t:CDS:2 [Diversispora eburnea]|uniref:2562_t:CDS:1 n=1 Tax=Diversispora eburnea TaxID=1213867 RepID=A0A9N8V426_9GLOM|nr:2562_t:CDS:2 [Diversispora eburnea]